MSGTDLIRLRCRFCEGSEWDLWGTILDQPPAPFEAVDRPVIRLPDGAAFELDSDDVTPVRCPSCLEAGVFVPDEDGD